MHRIREIEIERVERRDKDRELGVNEGSFIALPYDDERIIERR